MMARRTGTDVGERCTCMQGGGTWGGGGGAHVHVCRQTLEPGIEPASRTERSSAGPRAV